MKKVLLFTCFQIVALFAFSQCSAPPGDFDGDGIADAIDLDDDNDGIPDLVENGIGAINWTAAQLNSFGTTPFTATIPGGGAIQFQTTAPWTQYGGIGQNTSVNYNTVLTTDLGEPVTISRVLTFSTYQPNNVELGKINLNISPGTLKQLNLYWSDADMTSFIITAYDGNNNALGTSDWCTKTYETNGVSPANAGGQITMGASSATLNVSAQSTNYDVVRLRFGETTLMTAVRIEITIRRYSGGTTNSDGVFFFVSGISRPDTDGDGNPNEKDNDSDDDGCPDALEGGGPFTYTQVDANGRLLAPVNATGVPIITGVPQSGGTSYNSNLFDAQSACERPVSYPVSFVSAGTPALLDLGSHPLQGSDLIDLPAQGNWTGKAVKIMSQPTNGFILKHNGSIVNAGDTIVNYSPSLLTIEPSGSSPQGAMQTSFDYSVMDMASQTSAASATYSVAWTIALPLKLLSFSGKEEGKCNIRFTWKTREDEQGMYELQKSTDGKFFSTFHQMPAINQASTQEYSYIYKPVGTNANYYRLRITDAAGQFTFSRTILIQPACNKTDQLALFPNPAIYTITCVGVRKGELIKVFEAGGRQVKTVQVTQNGRQEIKIAQFTPGIYYVKVEGRGQTRQLKFIKR
ncbi:MAG: T9SS type A sorting domain-containing protein [Pseudobacter sp.]|uniref:T9SS type A sorting domain-containing protein n=1 Tax=Pseudobacter sp. TaxID=2045420 RepID=UPI003F7DC937